MGHPVVPSGATPLVAGALPAFPSADPRMDPRIPQGLETYLGIAAHQVLDHAASVIPTRLAIVYGEQSWTYDALQRDSIRCALALQQLGVKHGDRVALILPNVPEYIIAATAAWRLGAIVVAVNPMMVAEEVRRLLEATQCRHVVCLDLLEHLVAPSSSSHSRSNSKDCIEHRILVSIRPHLPALQQLGYLWKRRAATGYWYMPSDERTHWFWDAMNRAEGSLPEVDFVPETTPAYILPTGGTTGSPKAVVLSHQNMVANAWQQYVWTKRTFAQERMLGVLPFFHSYGMSATVMGGMMMGASLHLHHRFNAAHVIRMIETDRPTVFHAVPAMLVAMNQRLRERPANLTSLRWVISGGAPLDASVGEAFAKSSGALVVEGFGLSEASPVTHVGDLFGSPRYGTIGLALPETECRIASLEDGVDLPLGEVGELVVKGPQVMLGYWNDEAATHAVKRDGWLYTGDLAIRDAEGYFQIVGRKKDLIITSGFNVYPSEVEDCLRMHPDVADVAIIGLPDSQRGEVVCAVIVLRTGIDWNEDSLRRWSEEHLAKYKRPRVYRPHDGELPRNFLGKVLRRSLRESPSVIRADSVTTINSSEVAS